MQSNVSRHIKIKIYSGLTRWHMSHGGCIHVQLSVQPVTEFWLYDILLGACIWAFSICACY